jgi:hypothetical protein
VCKTVLFPSKTPRSWEDAYTTRLDYQIGGFLSEVLDLSSITAAERQFVEGVEYARDIVGG